jgi:hypothetical protein
MNIIGNKELKMVLVVKMGIKFWGADESQCAGDFWDDVREFVEQGEPVIIADTKQEAQSVCSGEINWVSDLDRREGVTCVI